MIKNITAAASLLMLLFCFSAVSAEDSPGPASGFLNTADAVGAGVGLIGGSVGFGDDAAAVYGSFTYGIADYTDIRFKLGFADLDAPDSDLELLLGFDFKYELLDYSDTLQNNPLDFALGAFIEYVDYEGFPILELGGNIIGSIPYQFDNGYRIVPYACLNIRMERVDYDAADESDTDIQGGLNLGTKFELSDDLNLFGEFQLDGNTGIYLGLDVRVF